LRETISSSKERRLIPVDGGAPDGADVSMNGKEVIGYRFECC
jgi:hypothetical protein